MTNIVDSSKPSVQESPPESPQAPQPKRPRQPWVWILAGTVAIAGIGAGAWYWFHPKNDNVIQLSGRIEGYETDVSTKGSGRVEVVTVREGARVKKGQLLVRLSDEEVQAQLQAAISQVNAANQKEANARLQIRVAQAQLADARLNLQQSHSDTQGKIAEAESQVATAQASLAQEKARVKEVRALLEQTRVDRDRYARLASLGAETQQRYDVAQTAFNTAQAALQSRFQAVETARRAVNTAQARLTQARTTTLNPSRQETNVNRLQATVEQARASLAAAQAEVKTAEANRQLIQTQLNNLTVNSPNDGVVTTRSVEPGTVVLPSRPLLRIVDMNQVYMRGFIPGGQLGQIRLGQPARVYLDNDPNRQHPFQASVASVDEKASFTPENVYFQKDRVEQVFGVKLSLDQPGGFAKPGMPADAEIVAEQK